MKPQLPAFSRLPQAGLLALVRAYRFFVSPWRPASCRFEPTCSAYALAAIERHGAAAGSFLAAHRVLRCGPWCHGGADPVPVAAPRLFRGFATPSSVPNPSPPP